MRCSEKHIPNLGLNNKNYKPHFLRISYSIYKWPTGLHHTDETKVQVLLIYCVCNCWSAIVLSSTKTLKLSSETHMVIDGWAWSPYTYGMPFQIWNPTILTRGYAMLHFPGFYCNVKTPIDACIHYIGNYTRV